MIHAHPAPTSERVAFTSGAATLMGTLHRPAERPRAALVLHGATGVPHRYYRHFAEWAAAERGLAVLSYDYRDFGASAVGPVRASRARMSDWGVHDQAAAQAALERLVPGAPIWVVGHSLGGLCLPFQPGAARVARLIAVASGTVHLSDHPWPYRALAASFWFGHGAAATRALGHLPAWAGPGAALPAPVFRQWRRWCTSRGFYEGDIGRELPMPDWRALRGRARFVAVADDPMAPPAAVWRLMRRYPEAHVSQATLRPQAFGLGRIGHVGVLGRASRATWPVILQAA